MPFITAVSVGEAHDCNQTIGWISNNDVRLRAAAIDDLGALTLEELRPFLHGRLARLRLARVPEAQRDARHLEQRDDLIVGELHEQAGKECAARFADLR